MEPLEISYGSVFLLFKNVPPSSVSTVMPLEAYMAQTVPISVNRRILMLHLLQQNSSLNCWKVYMHELICTFIKGGVRKLKASGKITRVRYFYNFSTLLVHSYVVDLTVVLSGESRPRRYTRNEDEEQNKRACIYQAVLMSRDFIFSRQGSGYLRLFGSLTKYAGHSAIAHFYRQTHRFRFFYQACSHASMLNQRCGSKTISYLLRRPFLSGCQVLSETSSFQSPPHGNAFQSTERETDAKLRLISIFFG